jgi:hypothetical protein
MKNVTPSEWTSVSSCYIELGSDSVAHSIHQDNDNIVLGSTIDDQKSQLIPLGKPSRNTNLCHTS